MEKTKQTHWADETAEKIIREKGNKERYTCASGITPSGTVHIGNFREIISVDLVVRALRDKGYETRFIYSWDDYDVFRKVPANMPKQTELQSYLRFPITMVPDPWERDESYARHHEVDVESTLPLVGIYPEYLYQAANYRSSKYAEGIQKALLHREELKEILDKFRDQDHKIQGAWWPVSAFCDVCNKDETQIESWDGQWEISYSCAACGHKASVDIRETKAIKLLWRIDWPMRWQYEQVDFEPAGKDHHSHGGSFDTAKLVSKQVYGYDPPVTFRYDFIGTKGTPGKMSSSKGDVVSLADVLKVYTPQVTRYLFAGTRPNTEFSISFDLDVIKIYEDYDKTERIAFKMENAKDEATYLKERRIYELSQIANNDEPRRRAAGYRRSVRNGFYAGLIPGISSNNLEDTPQRGGVLNPLANKEKREKRKGSANYADLRELEVREEKIEQGAGSNEQGAAYRGQRTGGSVQGAMSEGVGGTSPCLEDLPLPYQVPFRHLCNLIQIADGDIEKALANLSAGEGGPKPDQMPPLRARAVCAKYWVENCAPEEFTFRLLSAGEQPKRDLSDTEKNAVRILCDDVVAGLEAFADDKSCGVAIYAAAEKAGVDSKVLFAAAYQSLIGKDQGPRLANFLRSIGKERLLQILRR